MSSTTFTNGVTLTDEDWFNDLNRLHYTIFDDPADLAAAFGRINALSADSAGLAVADMLLFYDASDAQANRIRFDDALKGINNLTEDTAPDSSADYVVTYDGSAAAPKKVQLRRAGAAYVATSVSASGASVDFLSIPTGAKKITISFVGVSTDGTDNLLVQLGDSGGIEATGYLGSAQTGTTAANSTAGFLINASGAANVLHGAVTLTLSNTSTFTWVCASIIGGSNSAFVISSAGSKSTSAELDRVRITTTGGTNVFDAGSFGCMVEF